ncbi:calcium load-activated calcium channel [Pelomyxa schiedti]|nr:calcium load-activated calcium channel [Pelomyxa schiedti]
MVSISLVDVVIVIAFALTSACVAEGLAWLLVYRTENYRHLKENIEKLTQKLDKMKEGPGAATSKRSVKKKIDTLEEDLKTANRDISLCRMKSLVAVGISMITIVPTLNSFCEGRPVAKLPFVPFGFLKNITHRGLPFSDFTDCSAVFLYILCSMALRSSIQKIFGTEPPRGTGNSFFQTK